MPVSNCILSCLDDLIAISRSFIYQETTIWLHDLIIFIASLNFVWMFLFPLFLGLEWLKVHGISVTECTPLHLDQACKEGQLNMLDEKPFGLDWWIKNLKLKKGSCYSFIIVKSVNMLLTDIIIRSSFVDLYLEIF